MPTSARPGSASSGRLPLVPEIGAVRLGVPDQGALSRILHEGGATYFPQWLSAEPADEARILWWGIRGAPTELLEVPDDPARKNLFPRPIDDWTDGPRGLVLATVDLDRAAHDLAPALGDAWLDSGEDPLLDARCRRMVVGRGIVVLAEPAGEGYVAACLARFGEGPVAVALDGGAAVGRTATWNPVSLGRATYVRIGPRTAPTLIFLPVG
jgi:hypothetical protein